MKKIPLSTWISQFSRLATLSLCNFVHFCPFTVDNFVLATRHTQLYNGNASLVCIRSYEITYECLCHLQLSIDNLHLATLTSHASVTTLTLATQFIRAEWLHSPVGHFVCDDKGSFKTFPFIQRARISRFAHSVHLLMMAKMSCRTI